MPFCWSAHRQSGHLKAFDYTGLHRYFLTFCTEQRRPRFTSSDAVELVLSQILQSAAKEQLVVAAYCFMPDHVHLLVEGQADAANCRTFIKRAKQLSGFYSAKMFGGRLWQRYGFERVLRDDETTLTVARYIAENPVRANLVASPMDYPFIGSQIYSLAEILEAVSGASFKRSG